MESRAVFFVAAPQLLGVPVINAMNRFNLSLVVLLSLAGCQCTPAVCTPGTQSCACLEGGSCNDGLACGSDQKCAPAVAAGVHIEDVNARGCEFVLTESPGSEVVSVAFTGPATGTWIREAPRVAITVLAGRDGALGDSVKLGLTGAASGLTLSKASCVDLKGQRLATTLTIR